MSRTPWGAAPPHWHTFISGCRSCHVVVRRDPRALRRVSSCGAFARGGPPQGWGTGATRAQTSAFVRECRTLLLPRAASLTANPCPHVEGKMLQAHSRPWRGNWVVVGNRGQSTAAHKRCRRCRDRALPSTCDMRRGGVTYPGAAPARACRSTGFVACPTSLKSPDSTGLGRWSPGREL